jgi:peptide/nickel transport system permease protein
MHRYLIRRVLLVIPTLFIVSVIVFASFRLIPGDVIDAMAQDVRAGAAGGTGGFDRERLERALGIDKPMYVQYFHWIGDILLHGNLGHTIRGGVPVTQLISSRMATTFELGLMAIVIGLLIALPVGIYSAIRQDTVFDYLGRSVAVIGLSTPNFWLATMVLVYPVIWWGWEPAFELIPFTEDPLANLQQFIVPSLILGTGMSAITMRMTRTMMLEVLRQDYVRTARAKGLKENTVVMRHVLKNGLIPVVTIVGGTLPMLVGGAVVMEQIFALPGMGRLMLDALHDRDYITASGVNLVIASAIVGANLLVDISYAWLDPRVRYH